jgi:hypothetical protein
MIMCYFLCTLFDQVIGTDYLFSSLINKRWNNDNDYITISSFACIALFGLFSSDSQHRIVAPSTPRVLPNCF